MMCRFVFKIKILIPLVSFIILVDNLRGYPDTFPSGITLRGKELVEKYFPILVNLCDRRQEDFTTHFFDKWTKEDLLVLFESIYETGIHQSSTKELDFVSDFEGAMSTIYGMIELRKRYPKSEGYVVVTDLVLDRLMLYVYQSPILKPLQQQIRKLKVKKTRHDGLVYRWENGKLVIYRVFESKASGKYSTDQTLGVFQRWQKMGIYIGGFHIKPEDIFFKMKETDKPVNISNLNVEKFKHHIFLSQIKRPGKYRKVKEFLGERYGVPYSGEISVTYKGNTEFFEDFFMYLAIRLYSVLSSQGNRRKHIGITAVIQNYYLRFIKDLGDEYLLIDELLSKKDEDMFRFLYRNDQRLLTYGFVLPFFTKLVPSVRITRIMEDMFNRVSMYQGSCAAFFSSIDF